MRIRELFSTRQTQKIDRTENGSLPNNRSPRWPPRVPVPLAKRVRHWLRRSKTEPVWLRHLRRKRPDLLNWSLPGHGDNEEAAAALILGMLRDDWRIRAAFPQALSAGPTGSYCKFLLSLPMPAKITEHIRRLFADDEQWTVLNLYLHDAKLQTKMPDALLPSGKITFLKWLCNAGLKRGALKVWHILWFMQQADEKPGGHIGLTYHISPGWQAQFPDALAPVGWRRFFAWCVGQEFGLKESDLPASMEMSAPLPDKAGVNVLGHFCFDSGLQQAALNTVAALRAVGAHCTTRDIPVTTRAKMTRRTDFLDLEIHPVSLIHFTPHPFYRESYERAGLHRRAGVRRIGLCSWELPQIPEEWLSGEMWLDEVWGCSKFVAESVRAYPCPVYPMLPGIRLPDFTPKSRRDLSLPEEAFLFLFLFDMCSVMERKNPLGLIKAFRKAFSPSESAKLAIKVSHADQDSADLEVLRQACVENDIQLIEKTYTYPQTCALMDCCDAYVSLHRCEGFGLTMAEAMLLGKPVIATNYSGNVDFMNHQNSLLVDWAPTTILRDYPNYPKGGMWAEPDLDSAASQMRWTFDHPHEAHGLGAHAQRETEELLSIEAAGARILSRIGYPKSSSDLRQSSSLSDGPRSRA